MHSRDLYNAMQAKISPMSHMEQADFCDLKFYYIWNDIFAFLWSS